MMNIAFLGTGAGKPTLQRNVTSIALDLTLENGEIWLFDCGEATSHQIDKLQKKEFKEKSNLPTITLARITKIFITHLHGDHIFGLFGLLTSRSMSQTDNPLTLFGPVGIKQIINTVLETSQSFVMFPFEIIEIVPDNNPTKPFDVLNDGYFKVTAIELQHRVQSFAYRIEEKKQIGNLNIEELNKLQITDHTIYRKLKRMEKVTLKNGMILNPKNYLLPSKECKTVVIFGDTYPCENSITIARNANFIVHEATYSKEFEDLALQRGHSTTKQTAKIAKEANVQTLYFTHISARYFHENEHNQLVAESREIFSESYIAYDLDRIQI